MYLGHSGIALGATATDARIPLLWWLGAAWAYDMTGVGHWLPVAVLLAAIAFVVGRRRWDARAGALLAAIVLSHDVLDLAVGVQLLPGGRYWGLDPAGGSLVELALELALLTMGWWLYLRSLPAAARRRPLVLVAGGGLLVATLAEFAFNRSSADTVSATTLTILAVGAAGTAVLLVLADRDVRGRGRIS